MLPCRRAVEVKFGGKGLEIVAQGLMEIEGERQRRRRHRQIKTIRTHLDELIILGVYRNERMSDCDTKMATNCYYNERITCAAAARAITDARFSGDTASRLATALIRCTSASACPSLLLLGDALGSVIETGDDGSTELMSTSKEPFLRSPARLLSPTFVEAPPPPAIDVLP